jgi:transporter family-2 protein
MEGSSLQTMWLLVAAASGALIPVQAAVNSKMRGFVGQPLYSTFINFGVGTILLGAVLAAVPAANDGGSWKRATEAPWWSWTGGVLGIIFVTATVMVVRHTGQATFSVALLAGQMIGALLLDHYGWLGTDVREINGSRLLGVAFLIVAVWLMQK